MRSTYPHTIENGHGEQLTFVRLIDDGKGGKLEVENLVQPGSGPPMHVHFKQAESLTVIEGRIGVQVQGQQPTEHGPGETVTFEAGVAHRFWNAGTTPLKCKGWVAPANNLEYFLTEIYRSTRENSKPRPQEFDGAFLLDRYRSEFDMTDIPGFVKKVIFPTAIFFGKLSGKHKRYADAPEPVL